MARRLRIITGLILFLYATGHLINLAIGLNSVEAMDEWRQVFRLPWSNTAGRTVLFLSIVGHTVLSLYSLYHRNTLKMSATDSIQFAVGLSILPLLVPHVAGVRLAAELVPDYWPSYRSLLQFFWIQNPGEGLRQILVLVAVWVHGAIGLLTYFRLQPWWPKLGRFINPLMVIVPVSALLGFVEAGKEVIAGSTGFALPPPSDRMLEVANIISTTKWSIIIGYLVIVAMVFGARYFRLRNQFLRVEVQFVNGPSIDAEIGTNLLELAIAHDVSHASLCRGRGRCGTCRVKIVSTQNPLPPPNELELATLEKVGARPDERLACQVKPAEGMLTVEPVVPPYVQPGDLKTTFGDYRESRQPIAETEIEVSR